MGNNSVRQWVTDVVLGHIKWVPYQTVNKELDFFQVVKKLKIMIQITLNFIFKVIL